MLIESRSHLKVVGEAGCLADAVTLISKEQPDIILLDLDLKGEKGLDLLPQIKYEADKPRVLILTGIRDPEVHQHCFRLGARGLIHKEIAVEVLIKAIEKVHSGEIWFDRQLMSNLLNEVLNQKAAISADPERIKIESLTDRERQIIPLVSEGLKNKQIANKLFISDTTVRHHLTSIFSKLDISDRLELVIYAYRYGLAPPPER